MQRVLIADDEPTIRQVIGFALEKAGYATAMSRNGAEVLQTIRRGAPDLLILDIGMPEMDGLAVCREIRRTSDLPILFLSARDEEIDRVLGLEIGGDDYVTKPFSARELVARVGAILKRGRAGAGRPKSAVTHGKVRLDVDQHLVTYDDAHLSLTALEFEILATFMARPQFVFARETIMQVAYGGAIHVSDRTIDSHIRNLRGKFATAGCQSIIETVHGVGFRLGAAE